MVRKHVLSHTKKNLIVPKAFPQCLLKLWMVEIVGTVKMNTKKNVFTFFRMLLYRHGFDTSLLYNYKYRFKCYICLYRCWTKILRSGRFLIVEPSVVLDLDSMTTGKYCIKVLM